MKKTFGIGDHLVEVEFNKNRRSKGVKITLKNKGVFLVSYPWFVSQRRAEKFFLESEEWALKGLQNLKNTKYSSLLSWGERRDYLKNKERARALVEERLEDLNQIYNFSFNRIAIRDQQTRWGSCSSNRNLNFNYRVLFLPDELVDYLIVHELCHLQEMNHSGKFWELVERGIPEYKKLSRKLKRL
jgi:hypothetical protein